MAAGEIYDCVVIGGGPAGLTAALYLARFRRKVLLCDSGKSRARWIPRSHNVPGFPEGVRGPDFLLRLRQQVERHGPLETCGEVTALDRTPDGSWEVVTEGRVALAHTVVLATGVVDRPPPMPDVEDAIRLAVLRYCPICDGFEAMTERIAVIGGDDHAASEALFVRAYSPSVSLLPLGRADTLAPAMQRRLSEAGVSVISVRPESLRLTAGKFTAMSTRGEPLEPYDVVYSALGVDSRNALAQRLGASLDKAGCLIVDAHQQTNVESLYAAGDIVRGLDQISVAIGEAAVAATAIHNRLPPVPALRDIPQTAPGDRR